METAQGRDAFVHFCAASLHSEVDLLHSVAKPNLGGCQHSLAPDIHSLHGHDDENGKNKITSVNIVHACQFLLLQYL